MKRNLISAILIATSALALGLGTPALASKSDRAKEAIAAAQAKIDSARSVGAGAEVPRGLAAAQAELQRAMESHHAGHQEGAIQLAIHAQALADAALGEAQKRREADMAARRDVAAQQVDAARDEAAEARQQAAEANARAAAAEQAAAMSAQQAAAAQAAATAPKEPTRVETTVTTAQPAAAPAKTVVRKRTVKRKAVQSPAPRAVTRTTTSVTTTTTP